MNENVLYLPRNLMIWYGASLMIYAEEIAVLFDEGATTEEVLEYVQMRAFDN